MELHYRDTDRSGQVGDWETGPIGYAWRWHAAFWLPERIIAATVQNIGREVMWHSRQTPPQLVAARRQAEVIAGYLQRLRPPAPGAVREFRFVRRFATDDTAKLLLRFTAAPDAGVH